MRHVFLIKCVKFVICDEGIAKKTHKTWDHVRLSSLIKGNRKPFDEVQVH